MKKIFLGIILLLFSTVLCAKEQPLPANQAFALAVSYQLPNQLILHWHIAPGYYLYKKKISVKVNSSNIVIGPPIILPQGAHKHDALHGDFEAYKLSLDVPISLRNPQKELLNLTIKYQGCAEAGFCYAPITRHLKVNLAQFNTTTDITQYLNDAQPANKFNIKSSNDITNLFATHHSFFILLSFLGLGLLLAFTPCVLPMIPILSGIILGQRTALRRHQAFMLSFSYVLGMSIAYAIAGVIAALAGSSVQIFFQNFWVIIAFSSIFVLLAIPMIFHIHFSFANKWQQTISRFSARHKEGTLIGVFFMGALSTLIVSPCVSAPLIGVLGYIAETGNVILGGSALLALGFGMGIPLLIVGTSAQALIPKAGPWMENIKKSTGIMLLAFAIYMLSRVVAFKVTLLLSAGLLFFCAILILFSPNRKLISKIIGWLFLFAGFWLLTTTMTHQFKPEQSKIFKIVVSDQQLDTLLKTAAVKHQTVLLDFYADWCASCLIMDKTVFSNSMVKNALQNKELVRIDVTQNNTFDQRMMKKYQVFAPPTIILFKFTPGGNSIKTIAGEISAQDLLENFKQLDV